MKYHGKEYKWFSVMFEDGKPDGVTLYPSSPYGYNWGKEGKVTTYWENENLTEKPIIETTTNVEV
jgi:hypothetical protein